MLTRSLAFAAGFFVYLANLLCYAHAPAEVSKPQLVGIFAVIAIACAVFALARKSFDRWQMTAAAIVISGALMSAVGVAAVTLLRAWSTVRGAMGSDQLDFTDYRTGAIVTVSLLVAGGLLLWAGGRETR